MKNLYEENHQEYMAAKKALVKIGARLDEQEEILYRGMVHSDSLKESSDYKLYLDLIEEYKKASQRFEETVMFYRKLNE